MSMKEKLSSNAMMVIEMTSTNNRIAEDDICHTLMARMGTGGNQVHCILEQEVTCYDMDNERRRGPDEFKDISPALTARMGTGGNNTPMVIQNSSGEDISGTLDSNYFKGCGEREGTEREVVVCGEVAACLNAQDGRGGVHSQKMADPEGNFVVETSPQCIGNRQLHDAQSPTIEVSKTLNCMEDPMKIIQKDYNNLVVRRLTPKECSRLQGYPDGWMDIGEWTDSKGKLHKDSDAPKYKAAGNSIALPFWQWLMDRIAKQLKKDGRENPTMGSLFSGIGGFELCSIRAGIKPLFNSDIEEFPNAVTKLHFGDENTLGDIEKYIGDKNG